jgi:flagellin
MSFRLSVNIDALRAQRYSTQTSAALERALERLSTGKRINAAQDDAAGLAVSTGLEASRRGTQRAIQNLNESVGFLSTAEAGISTQIELVQRMRELAVQASNGTLNLNDRTLLNSEFQEILSEFTRLTRDTQIGGVRLLDGSFTTASIQTGTQSNDQVALDLQDTRVDEIFTRNRGTGAFESASTGGNTSYPVREGDFNGDGKTDIVTLLVAAGETMDFAVQAAFYTGNADGTFTLARTTTLYEGASTPATSTIAVGDFNNDGKDDVAISGSGSTSAYTILGQTDISDATPSSSFTLNNLYLQTADINGDGNLDLYGSVGSGNGNYNYALGRGDGTFEDRVSVTRTGSTGTTQVELRDINDDGFADQVFANATILAYQLGVGDGTFGATTNILSGLTGNPKFAFGDMNGDGQDDFVVSDSTTTVRSYMRNGALTYNLSSTQTLDTSAAFGQLSLYDVNSDGSLDVLALQSASSRRLSTLFNTGSGALQAPIETDLGVSTGTQFIVTDVADTRVPTVVVSNAGSGFTVFDSLTETSSAVSELRLVSQEQAQYSLGVLDTALNNLLSAQSTLGALQTRLDFNQAASSIAVENLSSATSLLVDADVAEETAELVRTQILQQAQVAVMAQANIQNSLALDLLR